MTTKFEAGKIYWTRSTCDSECIFAFRIFSRTPKSVRVVVDGRPVTRRISEYQGVEQFRPFGHYSMAAIISADRVKKSYFGFISDEAWSA